MNAPTALIAEDEPLLAASLQADLAALWPGLQLLPPQADGRSALDAVELMNVGWNYRREHLRLEQRSHYVITNGGDQPNVVPAKAGVWYYFRELDYEHIQELRRIGDTIAQAAAIAASAFSTLW